MPITFSATATGGPAPLQYKFLRYSAATGWRVAQDYSATNTFTWFPPEGENAVQVWVRAAGSTATYLDWMSTGSFTVLSATPKLTSLSPDVVFPVSFLVPITFTATAIGGTGPLQFKFLRYSTMTGWIVARDYGASNTFTWFPPQGLNAVQVWVRSAGSTVAYQDWASTGLFNVVATSATLRERPPTIAFPAGPTTTIGWTPFASGTAAVLRNDE
jgi:hypothetical protein